MPGAGRELRRGDQPERLLPARHQRRRGPEPLRADGQRPRSRSTTSSGAATRCRWLAVSAADINTLFVGLRRAPARTRTTAIRSCCTTGSPIGGCSRSSPRRPAGDAYQECVAVSATATRSGPTTATRSPTTNFPDYPKIGVWPDGYYVTYNVFAREHWLRRREGVRAGAARHARGRAPRPSSASTCPRRGRCCRRRRRHRRRRRWAPRTTSSACTGRCQDKVTMHRFFTDWDDPSETRARGPGLHRRGPVHVGLLHGGSRTVHPAADRWADPDSIVRILTTSWRTASWGRRTRRRCRRAGARRPTVVGRAGPAAATRAGTDRRRHQRDPHQGW